MDCILKVFFFKYPLLLLQFLDLYFLRLKIFKWPQRVWDLTVSIWITVNLTLAMLMLFCFVLKKFSWETLEICFQNKNMSKMPLKFSPKQSSNSARSAQVYKYVCEIDFIIDASKRQHACTVRTATKKSII